MRLTDHVDRHAGLSHRQFQAEYLRPLQPVILTDAISHWGAMGRWNPQFFKEEYPDIVVEVDGETLALGDLIDRILASTEDNPAPYLRNQVLSEWPPELTADVSPMPNCTRPNWLESRLFLTGKKFSSLEVYIGGQGAEFPILHYDGLHTHAFLMQLYGDKEYIAFSPDQTRYLYPHEGIGGIEANKSRIHDIHHPDFASFPLFGQAEGVRFQLHPGETLFVPAGWWHTARILSPSVTVSINSVNGANGRAFRSDYCAGIAQQSQVRSLVARTALVVGQATRLFELI